MDMDAISTESLKRVSREEDLLQFGENETNYAVEAPITFQADVVTGPVTPKVVDKKH